MKRVYILFAFLSFACFVNAQTVENIRIEPDGDHIRITYRIGGSTEAQLYNVTLTCSMDGKPRFEPKTLDGDFGANIRGGKPIYTVIWDVFEDVDEVGNAEFFIKVDLVSDLSGTRAQTQNQPQIQTKEEPSKADVKEPNPGLPDYGTVGGNKKEVPWSAYIAYSGSTASPIGLSFGSLKNFGWYGSFRYGSYIDDYETDIWFTFTTGLTKYIVQSGNYRLHGYAGAGLTYELYEEYFYNTSWNGSFLTIDFGIINTLGRLNINLGLEIVRYTGTYPVFGLGIVF